MPGLTEEQITDLAAEPDRVRRGLKMLALVGELVGDVPIVVGGFAVETYTQGGYTTGDIDALTRRRDEVVAVLGESGFERRARHWIHPELLLALEFPGGHLEPREAYDRVVDIDIDGHLVRMIGIEDLIVDRLCQYVHGPATEELDLAVWLLGLHGHRIDRSYLKRIADREKVGEALLEAYDRADDRDEP